MMGDDKYHKSWALNRVEEELVKLKKLRSGYGSLEEWAHNKIENDLCKLLREKLREADQTLKEWALNRIEEEDK